MDDWLKDLDEYDIAILSNEGLFVLTVIIIICVSAKREDNLKQRTLMMSRLMIAQAISTAILIFVGSIRVVPSNVGVITYWSLRSSNLDCKMRIMSRNNVGMPIFLLFTGITCNLGAYATWRKDFEKKNRASIVVMSILMFLAAVALAGLSLYPDHLCSDPFGGTLFKICIVCSQALSLLMVGIQMYFMISSACSSGSSKRTNSRGSKLFKSYIPKFLTNVSGVSTLVQDDGSKVARDAMDQESARLRDARRVLKFVLENNFLTSAFMMVLELMVGVRDRKIALRTNDLVLSTKKRTLLWFLVHYDNFVEISWRVVHLAFVSMGAIYLFRNFIHEYEFFDSNSYEDWNNLSVSDQESSNLCWVSSYLNQETHSIVYVVGTLSLNMCFDSITISSYVISKTNKTLGEHRSNTKTRIEFSKTYQKLEHRYDQSIYDRTQETKLEDLVGASFIPSHRCITVRDHVYLWMTLASFTLTLFSTILFHLIHCMNRWSSKIESDSGHVCARFLRLGLVVPALLMTPFVIYIFSLEIKEGTQVEAFVCADCVKTSSMFNRSACYDSKCVPGNAVGPRNVSYMKDDVHFVGQDYFLGVQILIGACFMQALGALIYLCWRRSGHGNSDRAEKRFFGIELSRFSRQKTELPLDDQGSSCSAVDEFETKDNETRNHIREIAQRAKALSLESHILKEAAGEQFVRSFMDLLEAEHDYGDVLHALVTKLIPLIHKYSSSTSPDRKSRTRSMSDKSNTLRRVMLSLGESRQVSLTLAAMNALHVSHIHFDKRLSDVMNNIITGAVARTPKTSKMKRKKSKKLLKRLDSHVERLRKDSSADLQGSSKVDIEIGLNDAVSSSQTVEKKMEQDEERHFSIAHGIQDADLSEIASAVVDLADLLPLYKNICLHAHHAAELIQRARNREKSVDKIFCEVELAMRDLNGRNFVENDEDDIPSINELLTRPLLRLESLENEIKSLKDALVLLRGYFHGTKLEKRTAVASVAMREAVKHWSKCNVTLQQQVERGVKWLELRHIQSRFTSTVSCLSRHRKLTNFSAKLYLFRDQIVVQAFLFNDAILFGIINRRGNIDHLQPYQLLLIRGGKKSSNQESKNDAPKSPTADLAADSNSVSGKVVDAKLINLENEKRSSGCCSCILYNCIDVFTYLYNTILYVLLNIITRHTRVLRKRRTHRYIVVVILCCSGDYWTEKNKPHKYRIRLKCEGMSDIVFRLQNDKETKKWYDDLEESLRKRSLIARGGLAPKKPAFLRRLASQGDVNDDDVGYNPLRPRSKSLLQGKSAGSSKNDGNGEEEIDDEEKKRHLEAERIRHFKELVSSERKYVASLNTLYEICILPLLDIVYRPPQSPNLRLLPRSFHLIDMLTSGANFPLSKACDKVKSARATVAISSLETILMIHRKFLEDLQHINHRKKGWIVGRTLLSIVPLFRMYEFYSAVQRSFVRILDDPAFRSLREKWSNHPRCNMLDIESFLIQPIQRLPRYSLLIRDILKSTPRNHKDFKILARAQGEMEMLLSYIDESAKS